ncbi:MAG: dTDP-4-dehydrorhamnose reductase [Flavobacteriaceae bacterium]|nr:dTDP-4-dehydrorhamnose reductase [Flavobacteriaceae bacterium]|tara:strand:+ start:5655 stop:6521 length:867 start_codon:yes stop_codon:yes gene_type:complete
MVNKKNILVTGANGQLGICLNEISNSYNHNFFFKGKEDLDITNFIIFENFIRQNKINTIINCAAYTDVNTAEQKKDYSNIVNNIAVGNIAKLCDKFNMQLIHISTDYVFDGESNLPYNENNKTNPKNHYGKTKLDGENKILNQKLENSAIIRTSWLYSNAENNFVNKIILKLSNQKKIFVVEDEIGSPTNAHDLSKVIMEIIPRLSNSNTEIYHFSNLGFCSRYHLANIIRELVKGDCKIIPTKDKLSSINRPKFSALDSSKIIEDFQLKINSWESSLKTHLKKNNIT